ncbi:hypothetical protein [Burkholderia cepacia]|uniref:hypothetical protein n=1 Tax=Burkholderia cepacia TaxID=292 RepID=UPI000A52C014|nr:hypothetical protein [Burkholderia cepacia]
MMVGIDIFGVRIGIATQIDGDDEMTPIVVRRHRAVVTITRALADAAVRQAAVVAGGESGFSIRHHIIRHPYQLIKKNAISDSLRK